MKTIEPVQIWDNGQIKTAQILNAYVSNLNLNQNATFNYYLYAEPSQNFMMSSVSSGSVYMPTEEYLQWDQDEFAWDFVAKSLNLTITGDYIPPQPVENIEENA